MNYTTFPMTGLRSLSEYEFQKDNGVLRKLEGLLHYTTTVYPGSSIKQEIDLSLSIRSVAGFNVQCELTRQQLLETLQ